MEWSYEKAGVNIDAGNEAARRIRQHLKATRNLLVRGEEGGFGGLFRPFPPGNIKTGPGRQYRRGGEQN